MQAELQALRLNNTWTLTTLPPHKTAIGCRWIYKIKYHADVSIERYKERETAVYTYTIQLPPQYSCLHTAIYPIL